MAGLHVLVDDNPRWQLDPVEQGEAALLGGASVIQLRVKHAGDNETLSWARHLRGTTHRHGALLIINDRFDLALLAEADGVHLGQDDLPPERIPPMVRKRLLVGISTHNIKQVNRACSQPVDYVAFGPIFGTGSKQSEYSPRGTEILPTLISRVRPRLLVAIGGIHLQNVPMLKSAGIRAIAVISAIVGDPDPAGATRNLITAFIDDKNSNGA